MTIVASK